VGGSFGLFFDDRVTKLLSCLAGDDRRVVDPGAYDEPSHVELTAEERKVLRSGLLMWGGPARMTDHIARCLWFGTAAEFDAERNRLMSAIEEGVALMPLDWHRILAATEIAFISFVLGAGGDWYIVSGLDEHVTLDHLRSIQSKLAWVRPWPEPYARLGHTSTGG
jgi:hypothetical protein